MNTLIIPNKISRLLILQSFVIESAQVYKLPNNLIEHLKLISEEAFLHILKTSFMPGESSEVKIITDIDNSYFKLSFFDKGLPFDATLAKKFNPSDNMDSLDIEGMNLFIIKQYVTNIQWISHGNKGKEFRLLIELPDNDIVSMLDNTDQVQEQNFVPNPEDIEIRPFKEADAIRISQAIYKTYGYTYPNEDLYYPKRIIEQNNNGELISIVSFDTKRGEVVGHYALERVTDSAIAESGQAVVAPKYRGFNLMEKMRIQLEQLAKELLLDGIMSQPVTTHIYSQKANARFASSPCGFSFGLVPKKLSFRKIHQSLSQRESCLTYFKILKNRPHKVFIPKKHKEIIQSIYKNMELNYEPGNTNYATHSHQGIVKSTYSPSWGIGEIKVTQLGKSNQHDIKQALHNLLFTMKAEVIFLFIPLEDADINELVMNIEDDKFFFNGLIPSFFNAKDVIRFEYLNGSIDHSKINIYEERARKLFNYILNEKEKTLK